MQQRQREARRTLFRQRFVVILDAAHHAHRRRRADDQGMQHRAQRVNISPGPLLAFVIVAVLLNWREAGAQHGLRLVGEVADGLARGAEIQQHRHHIFLDLDVIQRNIAMQVAFLMDGVDGAEQRRQQTTDPGLVHLFGALRRQARQRGAAVEHRAHIGGVVLHPEAQHVQQVGMIKARQQPRLLNKAVQSGMKRLAEALAAQHQIQVVAAHRQRSRHEFFNGDGAFQLMIPGAINDPETAAANYFLNLKLIKTVPNRQCVRHRPVVIVFRHDGQLSDS